MGIHTDFASFVEENAELVDSRASLLGEKMFYRYRDYLIVLDLGKAPDMEESRVVAVMKDGKFVYVSKYVVKGSAVVLGIALDPRLADSQVLSELLKKWRGGGQ